MGETNISWTDYVWNPVTGCTKISPGCQNCYAARMAKRLAGRYGYPAAEPFQVTLHPDRLDEPFRWKKPRRVFVPSMGDLFHANVPLEYIDRVFAVMAWAWRHTFLVLTKRPERMAGWFQWVHRRKRGYWCGEAGYLLDSWHGYEGSGSDCSCVICRQPGPADHYFPGRSPLTLGDSSLCAPWPLPNVWLGYSASTQADLERGLPHLLDCPAALRFLSLEPLLGPIDLRLATRCDRNCSEYQNAECPGTSGPCIMQRLVDWVIVGGESGHNARPCDLAWVRSIRDQSKAAGVPFFYKQRVENGKKIEMPELDGQDWKQFPSGEMSCHQR